MGESIDSSDSAAVVSEEKQIKQRFNIFGYSPWERVDSTRPAAADLMRVVATGAVGWFHIWQQSWVGGGVIDRWPRSGAAMVDVMVMLSAFCLFLPYANAVAEGKALPEFAPLNFYRKRAVRIVPSYYVNIISSLIIRLVWYGSNAALWFDFAAHLTFTQTFFSKSYTSSQLNGVTWTLTIFAIFYLVFPFLARIMCKAPVQTLTALLAAQWAWSCFALRFYGTNSYAMLFNQFPAFCGVFAVGFTGAWALAYLSRRPVLQTKTARVTFTLLGIAAFYGLDKLIGIQSSSADYQRTQLVNRMPLVLVATVCMVCLALGITLPLRKVWSWLSSISYNFYLWHQMLSFFLKYNLHLPEWSGELPPNQLGDTVWQEHANTLYWLAALAAAVFFTYGVELPVAHVLKKRFKQRQAEQ